MKWRETKILPLLATGLGLGNLPKAPGTWGTLGGVLLYCLLPSMPLWIYISLVALAFLFGCWLCEKVSQQMKVHDSPHIVWDEIVGYLVTMVALPKNLIYILAGFFLFRFFDIIKPWPISLIDRKIKNGVGIMLDDVLAGGVACVILHLAHSLSDIL